MKPVNALIAGIRFQEYGCFNSTISILDTTTMQVILHNDVFKKNH